MSVKEVTFFFSKEPGTWSLRCLPDALQDEERFEMLPESGREATKAVTEVFQKLIARDAAKYQAHLFSLRRFAVTLSINPISQETGLKIQSDELCVSIKLKKETTDLFQKAIPASKPAKPPQSSPNLNPVVYAEPRPPTPKETIFGLFGGFFSNTKINDDKSFGKYLLEKVFGKATSYEFIHETLEFTLKFATPEQIHLKNLPQGKSSETETRLKPALGCTLYLAQEVKGKFDVEKREISFTSGSLTLGWMGFWASLRSISENGNNEVAFTSFTGTGCRTLPAQDAVDFFECNLPK